jgi:alkanesulfonate monooxygenase SsuD/methylene tetrahydromethanopterin reductase-like flavin-dependent oxidoreductase (luciferase family)
VTTTDHISDRRVELRVIGWYGREPEARASRPLRWRARGGPLEEPFEVVLANWADGPGSFDEKHCALSDLDAQP